MNLLKKFVDVVSLKNWQIESQNVSTGETIWNDIVSIGKTVKYDVYRVKFSNGIVVKCADNHIFIDDTGNEVFAKDCLGWRIKCKDGWTYAKSVDKLNRSTHMYDVQLSEDSNHLYYSNGILSHNTTIYTVYLLWYAMFHPDKRIMICGNQLNIAIEIMNKIRLGYEYCPSSIKIGVTTYNKQCIEFENNSVIRCFSTSSDGTRGFSANCVTGNTWIRVRLFGWLKLKLPIFMLKWFGHQANSDYDVVCYVKEDGEDESA